jgi:hemerythrin-like metal-binding protein
MELFEFSEKYSVGIHIIDQQHKKLFALINQLYTAMKQSEGKTVLGEVLRALEDYARNHFSREEEYMLRFKYPDYATHVAAHVSYIMKIAEFRQDLEVDKLALPVHVMTFLRNWLTQHILMVDKKYSATFQEHGLK